MVGISKNLKEIEGQMYFHQSPVGTQNWHIFDLLRQFRKLYPCTKSNLVLLWQWLAAWKPLKSGSHRGLNVLSRICYFRYLKLVVVFPEHFICHATGKDLKMESAEFQHKSENEFSQKESHSVLNWRQFSRFLFSNRLLKALISFE